MSMHLMNYENEIKWNEIDSNWHWGLKEQPDFDDVCIMIKLYKKFRNVIFKANTLRNMSVLQQFLFQDDLCISLL